MYDLYNLNNKINIFGLDISKYAKENSHELIKNKILTHNCKRSSI